MQAAIIGNMPIDYRAFGCSQLGQRSSAERRYVDNRHVRWAFFPSIEIKSNPIERWRDDAP